MALNKNELKEKIIQAFSDNKQSIADSDDMAKEANKVLADTLSKYIKDNAEINFSWTATSPPPASTPDPITTAKGAITVLTFNLSPSGLSEPAAAMTAFKLQLQLSMAVASYNITDAGFITSPAVYGAIPPPSISVDAEEYEDAILQLSDGIVSWIKGFTPLLPCAGSHGIYIGSGSPTSVS